MGGGSSGPQDMRTNEELARDNAIAKENQQRLEHFQGLQSQEDLGYASSGRGAAIAAPYQDAIARVPEQSANIYASGGFGPKGVGPQAAGTLRETRRLEQGQAQQTSGDVANWRQYVTSSGDTPLQSGGPAIAQGGGGGGSGGSALGSLLGAGIGTLIAPGIGTAIGGSLGGAAGGVAQNAFSGNGGVNRRPNQAMPTSN